MNNAFSLRFLFILVTAAAAMATTFTGLASDELRFIGLGWLLGSAFACGLVGGVLGAVMGLHNIPRFRGAALGAIVGGLTGACMAPLLFANLELAPRVLAAQVIGAVMLVALGISARLEQP